MGNTHIASELRRRVRERAQDCCEYCLMPEMMGFASHEIDHIVAVKHGGETVEENLGLSCVMCNRRKASDLASIDPETGEIAVLFHPRRQSWHDHFRLHEGRIDGVTPAGRATVALLRLNEVERLAERWFLQATGIFGT